MNLTKTVKVLLLISLISSCSDETENPQLNNSGVDAELHQAIETSGSAVGTLLLGSADDLSSIPQDPKNPLTREKVLLGKFLFHETGLAMNPQQETGMGTYSCASCHHIDAGFQSGLRQGIGEGGSGFGITGELRVIDVKYNPEQIDKQPIKTPTALNSAYQKLMLWNGQFGATNLNLGTEDQWTEGTPKATNKLGYEGVETQAIAGLDVHRLAIDLDIIQTNNYKTLFDQAFPNIPSSERFSLEYAGLAIAAYERTLVADQAPFQEWLRGNSDALTDEQKKGAILFFSKGKCFECHNGPALNNMDFHALGMNDLTGQGVHGVVDEAAKKGRGGFTQNPKDNYTFKTPQLYNLIEGRFYGHGASFTSVRQIIAYKNAAIPENSEVPTSTLSDKFAPLLLTEAEIDLLTTFVETALNDPNLQRYTPSELPSGNCFPNADEQSKLDMNCE